MSGLEDQLDAYLGVGDQTISDGDIIDGEYIDAPKVVEIPMDVKKVVSEFDVIDIQNDLMSDYIHSRNVLHTLLERATTAVEGAMRVAVELENPRAYEVVKGLIDCSKDLSKDILNLHKQCKEIKKIENTTPQLGNDADIAEEDVTGGFKGTAKDLSNFMKNLDKQ